MPAGRVLRRMLPSLISTQRSLAAADGRIPSACNLDGRASAADANLERRPAEFTRAETSELGALGGFRLALTCTLAPGAAMVSSVGLGDFCWFINEQSQLEHARKPER